MYLLDGLTSAENDGSGKIPGLVTGVVKENWNKDCPGLLKVEMLVGEDGKNVTGWIPSISSYAGDGCGAYFLPEVGSEVVMAFLMGERSRPVVLGCLWNSQNKLPKDTAGEKNQVKRFKSKGGCEVVFDDTEKKTAVRVTTPGKITMSLEDEGKTITVRDDSGENGILIDGKNGEVKIFAKNKISLESGGNPMVDADAKQKTVLVKAGEIKLEASQGFRLKGQNDSVESAMLQIKAQNSLKLESGMMAELKGSMVKIN